MSDPKYMLVDGRALVVVQLCSSDGTCFPPEDAIRMGMEYLEDWAQSHEKSFGICNSPGEYPRLDVVVVKNYHEQPYFKLYDPITHAFRGRLKMRDPVDGWPHRTWGCR